MGINKPGSRLMIDDSAFKGLKMQPKQDKGCVSDVMEVLVKTVITKESSSNAEYAHMFFMS